MTQKATKNAHKDAHSAGKDELEQVPFDPDAEMTAADAALVAESARLLNQLAALWHGRPPLSAEERSTTTGRSASRYVESSALLRRALVPPAHPPDPADQRAVDHEEGRALVAATLDLTLGAIDGGHDAARFEPATLSQKLAASAAIKRLTLQGEATIRLINDQVLAMGNDAVQVYLLALGQLHTLAKSNPKSRTVSAPVFDAMRDMTAAARAAGTLPHEPPASDPAPTTTVQSDALPTAPKHPR